MGLLVSLLQSSYTSTKGEGRSPRMLRHIIGVIIVHYPNRNHMIISPAKVEHYKNCVDLVLRQILTRVLVVFLLSPKTTTGFCKEYIPGWSADTEALYQNSICRGVPQIAPTLS